MQDHPKPFSVIQNGRCLFTIHCYSAEQAREVVASRLTDTDVVIVPLDRSQREPA
jgi:hypothetical protein